MSLPRQPSPDEQVRDWWKAFSKEQLLALYLPAFALSLGLGIAVPALPSITKQFEVSFGVA